MARLLTACMFVLLLAAGPASAASGVNVVQGFNLGCSGDRLTDADMRVTLFVDGDVVARTVKAQDLRNPLFAFFHPLPAGRTTQVTFMVEEAEPGGFLGLGTAWEECDVSPGQGTRHTVTWDGSHRHFTLRGDGGRAAEIDVTLGGDAPAAPEARFTDVRPTGGTLVWDAGGSAHKVAWGGAGRVLAEYGPGAGSHTLDGLCDGMPYWLRVIRVDGDWQVATEDIVLETTNLPPLPPAVVEAAASADALEVRVHLPTQHDLAALEVHATDARGQTSASTLVQRFERSGWSPAETHAVQWAGATHVVAVAEDQKGLRAESQAFRVGSSPSTASPPTEGACWPEGAAGPGSPATGSDEDPGGSGAEVGDYVLRTMLLFAMVGVALVLGLVALVVVLTRK